MWPDNEKCHLNYVQIAWDSGFTFEKCKNAALDKNRFCVIDIERVIKERDFLTIEENIPFVTQYVLDKDQSKILDRGFVKMFRLSQLSLEYLQFCKTYLDQWVENLKVEIEGLNEENTELKKFIQELEDQITNLTNNRYALSKTHSDNSQFSCVKCRKSFLSVDYLTAHIRRRHAEYPIISNEEDEEMNGAKAQLESEIKELKERLNNAEKQLEAKNHKEIIEKDQLETTRELDNMRERFNEFQINVEEELKSLRSQRDFFEDKYIKLLDLATKNNFVMSSNSAQEIEGRQQQMDRKLENLNIETVTNKNVICVKDSDTEMDYSKKFEEFLLANKKSDSDSLKSVAMTYKLSLPSTNSKSRDFNSDKFIPLDVSGIINEKITKFEENIEGKVLTGLKSIELQMIAFWEKLSELQKLNDNKLISNNVTPNQENLIIDSKERDLSNITENDQKPIPKPRSKLTHPSKLIRSNFIDQEVNFEKLDKTELVKVKLEDEPLLHKSDSEESMIEQKDSNATIIYPKNDDRHIFVKQNFEKNEKFKQFIEDLTDDSVASVENFIKTGMKSLIPIALNKIVETPRIIDVTEKITEVKPSISTLDQRSITSLKKASRDKNLLANLRTEVEGILSSRLQEIGVSMLWNSIPDKTFQSSMEIIQHKTNAIKKNYKNFDKTKASIEKQLEFEIEKMKALNKMNEVNTKAIRPRKTKKIKSDSAMNIKEKNITKSSKSTVEINRAFYDTDSDLDEVPKKYEVKRTFSTVINQLKSKFPKNISSDGEQQTHLEETESNNFSNDHGITAVPSTQKKRVNFNLKRNEMNSSTSDNKSIIQDLLIKKDMHGGSTTSVGSSVYETNLSEEDSDDFKI